MVDEFILACIIMSDVSTSTIPVMTEPSQTPNIQTAIQRYQNALEQVSLIRLSHTREKVSLTKKSPIDSHTTVLELLVARDYLQTVLQDTSVVSASAIAHITNLDQQLRDRAGTISPYLASHRWKDSRQPSESAWWWDLTASDSPVWLSQDWFFKGLSIVGLSVSLSVISDISTRLLPRGLDTLGSFAVGAPSILALLGAGNILTQTHGKDDQSAVKGRQNIFKHTPLAEQYWHEAGAIFSLVLMLGLIGLRTQLPQIANAYVKWGVGHYKGGNWNTATEDFQRALDINPDNEQANFHLGVLAEDLQQPDKALSYYQVAARAGNTAAINNLARLYILRKNYGAAVTLLIKALNEQKNADENTQHAIRKNFGWARLMQKDLNDAAAYLGEAIAIQKQAGSKVTANLASPHCLLAQVQDKQNDAKSALVSWNTCKAQAEPGNPEEDAWGIMATKILEQPSKKLIK
jgi:tetratricopeptide (TPR) repeat protein